MEALREECPNAGLKIDHKWINRGKNVLTKAAAGGVL